MEFAVVRILGLTLGLAFCQTSGQNTVVHDPLSGLRQLNRSSGYIFAGTVLSIQPLSPNAAGVATVQITFRIDQAIRGTRSGQVLTIREWARVAGSDASTYLNVSADGGTCQILFASAVPPSMLHLEPVGGTGQAIAAGGAFKPVTVRAIDSAAPPHPVSAAGATFQSVVSRPVSGPVTVSIGGIIVMKNPPPVIVAWSRLLVLSDASGLATLQPSIGKVQGALVIQGTVAAGTSVLPFQLQSFLPPATSTSQGAITHLPVDGLHERSLPTDRFPNRPRMRSGPEPQSHRAKRATSNPPDDYGYAATRRRFRHLTV